MFKINQYIILSILLCLVGQPLQASNQEATERLRQGIIEGNPDKVKASITDGANINAQEEGSKDTIAMLALREYMKALDEGIKTNNPWNIAISAGVLGTAASIAGLVLGLGVASTSSNKQAKNIAANVAVASFVTLCVAVPSMLTAIVLKSKKSEIGKRATILITMLVDNPSIDFSIKNNNGQTLLDVYQTYAKDMLGNKSKQKVYDTIETYIKKKIKEQESKSK